MTRPYIIGLTGSIGMGKSTTAKMFAALGCEIWDADAAVHRLYAKGGTAVAPVAELYPAAIEDGAVSRAALKAWIAQDDTALGKIETVVHPLVAEDRAQFIKEAQSDIVVLDIPLLFEGGRPDGIDTTVVVSAPPEVQQERVMARPGMTLERFHTLLANQMPDAEKRARADFVIETIGLEPAQAAVQAIVEGIRQNNA